MCGIAHNANPWVQSFGVIVTKRRLDDRIRELCDQALAAQSAPEWEAIIADLQSALREHNERLRKRVALRLAGRKNAVSEERRGEPHS
jgi:hypothetical protein